MASKYENVSIWRKTVDLLRMAAALATVQRGKKVSQVRFMHEAVSEKVKRDGLVVPEKKVKKV